MAEENEPVSCELVGQRHVAFRGSHVDGREFVFDEQLHDGASSGLVGVYLQTCSGRSSSRRGRRTRSDRCGSGDGSVGHSLQVAVPLTFQDGPLRVQHWGSKVTCWPSRCALPPRRVSCRSKCRSSPKDSTFFSTDYTLGGMCMEAICPICERPSWAGCGAHVEQVLGHVPATERCRCTDDATSAPGANR